MSIFSQRQEESDTILFTRKINRLREELKEAELKSYRIEKAALNTLRLYGVEAVDKFHELLTKENNQ